jgi:chromosome partitioning protein
MIISIVNQKGGVGKTTTAVNLGAALARAGHPTLLVDLDPQGNASSGVGIGDEQRLPGIYELLRGEVAADAAMRPTAQENYHVMPATADLAGASVELMNVDNREFRLREVLAPLKEQYSYIIIDAPPSLGVLTMNALVAAERVLIPVQCEYYALEGLGQLLQTIGLVKEHLHPELEVLGAVLTLFDRRVKVAHDVIKEVREHFPGKVFETVIPRNIRLAEAPSYGKNIFEYDDASQGAQTYQSFAQEVHDTVKNLINQQTPQT